MRHLREHAIGGSLKALQVALVEPVTDLSAFRHPDGGGTRVAAEEMQHPVVLHLDHGARCDLAARCIEASYTSVMIDGSKLPFDENCAVM